MNLKKYTSIFLCLLVFFNAPLSVSADSYQIRAPHMYAHSYAVMDANTGEILFGENVDKQIYPASTAKLMSAIVAVESGVPFDTMIETESRIVNNTTLGTYNLGLRGGEHYSLSNLLNMCLIASAADATDTMAVSLYGSRDAFCQKMMEKVNELGLTNTSFDNPVGSDIGGGFDFTYSTAREMCEITRYAMTLPSIRKIVRKSSYTITGDGSQSGRQISNTNWFYNQYPYNSQYFTIIGSKTGQTTAAGNVFIATAVDDKGHELICAYFGRDTKEETFRWINNLLTYAFKSYEEGNLSLAKGAHNIRYHKGSTAIVRSMTCNLFKQQSDGTLDYNCVLSEKQAVKMIKASLEPEFHGSSIPSYFDEITGSDADCTKEFFKTALSKAASIVDDNATVYHLLESCSQTVTLEEAAMVLTAAIDRFDLYTIGYPNLTLRTWTMDNPMPFISEPIIPIEFMKDFLR